MRFLRRAFLGAVAILAILAGAAFLLPKDMTVERSIVVAAPAETIFPYLNNPRKFNEWSPWIPRDPAARYEFAGPEEGVGARMTWASERPDVGSGTSTVTGSETPTLVFTEAEVNGLKATTKLELSPIDPETAVTWTFETDLGNNPVARWLGLVFARLIAQDYDEGLARLKRLVETGSADAK
ncbi:MAG: SRPBCC family protein [Hyphomicrobiales bacterium]|nr:SRPBCC family protein [Hyphomicrobiales bacterium]